MVTFLSRLLWFVLAGFILGFATSTLWEWYYYRAKRLYQSGGQIEALEEALEEALRQKEALINELRAAKHSNVHHAVADVETRLDEIAPAQVPSSSAAQAQVEQAQYAQTEYAQTEYAQTEYAQTEYNEAQRIQIPPVELPPQKAALVFGEQEMETRPSAEESTGSQTSTGSVSNREPTEIPGFHEVMARGDQGDAESEDEQAAGSGLITFRHGPSKSRLRERSQYRTESQPTVVDIVGDIVEDAVGDVAKEAVEDAPRPRLASTIVRHDLVSRQEPAAGSHEQEDAPHEQKTEFREQEDTPREQSSTRQVSFPGHEETLRQRINDFNERSATSALEHGALENSVLENSVLENSVLENSALENSPVDSEAGLSAAGLTAAGLAATDSTAEDAVQLQEITQPQLAAHEMPDDLAQVKGIGRVFRARLYEDGICTWHQLSMADTDRLTSVTGARPNVDTNAWKQHALELAAKHQREMVIYAGPAPENLDDIDGITPSMMRQLFQAGIRTFEELASSKPDDLVDIFQAMPTLSRNDLTKWIQRAQERGVS